MLVSGGAQRDGEAAPVGVGVRRYRGGVGDRDPYRLVGHQQGVDLLLQAGRGASAQHPSAQDGVFELAVGGLDLPPLVIQPDQVGGRAVAVQDCGDQLVGLAAPPSEVVMVTWARMTRTWIAPIRDSHEPSGSGGRPGAGTRS